MLALDRSSGEKVWEQTVVGNVRGLAVSDGLLTVSTDAGHLYGFAESQHAPTEVKNWPPPPSLPYAEDELTETYRSAAKEILERSGHRRGYCLVIGSEQGRLAYELAQQSELTIIASNLTCKRRRHPGKRWNRRASMPRA